MTVPTVSCTNCGKNFTTDDLRGTSCRYCGTVLAHHARAAQQVAVVQQMMTDQNGNGIPDAFEGIVANAQANAMNQAFGAQRGYAAVVTVQNPYGQPMPPAGGMGMPGMAPQFQAHAQIHQAANAASKAIIFAVVGIVVVTMLVVGIGMAFFLFV